MGWLAENKPAAITSEHSSHTLLFAHVGVRSIASLLQGAFAAFLVIAVMLAIMFRSALVGLVSLLPNLLPIGAAFGCWALLNGKISMGLAGVSAMAIGIIVDDTVHFLYHYIQGVRQHGCKERSLRETFSQSMSGIVISSVLLMLGFLVLSFSTFEKNAQMGILTGMTIGLALLFDLLLLPAFMLLIPPRWLKRRDNIAVCPELHRGCHPVGG